MNDRDKNSDSIQFDSEKEGARFLKLIQERIALADEGPQNFISHEEVFAESRARLQAMLLAQKNGELSDHLAKEGECGEDEDC